MRDKDKFWNFPLVTPALILVNFFVFIYKFFLEDISARTMSGFYLIPYDFINSFEPRQAFNLLGSLFVHGDLLHLAGNMIYLWIFGVNLEQTLGQLRFLVFYLSCGIVSSLVYVLIERSAVPVIGASGAISGILGAYFVLLVKTGAPKNFGGFCSLLRGKKHTSLFLIVWILLGALFLDKAVFYSGHLGGFFVGVVFVALLKRLKYSDIKLG